MSEKECVTEPFISKNLIDIITFKPFNKSHIDELQKLDHNLFYGEEKYSKYTLEYIYRNGSGIIVFNGSELIGYILTGMYNYLSNENKKVKTIWKFGVKKNYQKYGIGSKLFSLCLDQHKEYNIYLHVRRSNEKAQSLYTKFGFKKIGIMENFYGSSPTLENLPDKEDALYMEKISNFNEKTDKEEKQI
jgi:ribosomal protein S18 acetylase RimI-like enzyme